MLYHLQAHDQWEAIVEKREVMNVNVNERSTVIQVGAAPNHSFGAIISTYKREVGETLREVFYPKTFTTAYIQ